jgi:hypothetical protein
MLKGMTKLPEAEVPNVSPKGVAREVMGVSDKDIAPAIKKSRETAIEDTGKHIDKTQAVKDAKAAEIAENQAKRIEASKAETAGKVKADTTRGPYRRMAEMADTAQKNVQEIDKKVRAVEGAKWNALRRKVGNNPVDWTPVQQSVVDAEQKILQGSPENIAIFRNIMKEGGGSSGLQDASVFRGSGGVDVKEFLSSIKDPVARNRFIEEMRAKGEDISPDQTGIAKSGATVPLDTARGFYTEIGQQVYGRELPGDVRRALRSVQDTIDSQVQGTIRKAGGPEAVKEYSQLKENWRDYMETFYDRDSPIRKLKEGADPNDKLHPIVGDEGARAIKMLGKYKQYGADVQTLGKTRALFKAAKELMGGGGKMPGPVEKPALPEPPSTTVLSPEDARRAKLQQAAQSYAKPPSRWELMFPPLLAYRLGLKRALQNPRVVEWLSKGTTQVP